MRAKHSKITLKDSIWLYKMERISIFNYEAFYLDFLEGNLSKEDTALLLEFLEANPDLKMEDESLIEFEAKEIELENSLKEELKQPSIQDEITTENVSFFMVSDAEGLLEPSKSKELDRFIGDDKLLLRERELFSMVYFKPDESKVFDQKESLMHKKNIVLWPYITGAAAACVLAFFLIWSSKTDQGVNTNNTTPVFAEEVLENNKEHQEKSLPVEETVEKGPNSNKPIREENQESEPGENSRRKEMEQTREATPFREMNKLETKTLMTSFDEQQIEPIAKRTYLESVPVATQQDYAMLHFSEMNNPIEPITNIISKQTNREVEFKRAKKSKNKAHGFFIKIGKFELSRKKNP